ncbi:MAG: hypothetical protein PHN19_04285 [Patescibacteria group bacterium]|nr:hypothetical protein [Patescibacteria group bacterium]
MQNFKPLGDFFHSTWNQFEKNWGNYVGVSAIFTIAQFVVIFIIVFSIIFLQFAGILGSIPLMINQDQTAAGLGGILMLAVIITTSVLLFFIVFGLSFLLNSWLMSSLITLIAKKHTESLDFVQFIKSCWPKVWKVFFALVLIMLIIFAGFICFIIPGIIFSLWLSQTLFLIILDNLSIGEAFKKSKELVKGYMGTVFLYNFVFILIIEVGMMAVNIIPFLGTMAMPFLSIVVTPLIIIFQYQIFLELKKIKHATNATN